MALIVPATASRTSPRWRYQSPGRFVSGPYAASGSSRGACVVREDGDVAEGVDAAGLDQVEGGRQLLFGGLLGGRRGDADRWADLVAPS
ncbi:hypothetical protein ABZ372_39980 [Streptomyces sp. NPDC005921]|uniref:hypothetical protein n=1 Tax=Streptomyces sp. NPDC005827 TaxID=3157070 RepID=UPI0033E9BB77